MRGSLPGYWQRLLSWAQIWAHRGGVKGKMDGWTQVPFDPEIWALGQHFVAVFLKVCSFPGFPSGHNSEGTCAIWEKRKALDQVVLWGCCLFQKVNSTSFALFWFLMVKTEYLLFFPLPTLWPSTIHLPRENQYCLSLCILPEILYAYC